MLVQRPQGPIGETSVGELRRQPMKSSSVAPLWNELRATTRYWTRRNKVGRTEKSCRRRLLDPRRYSASSPASGSTPVGATIETPRGAKFPQSVVPSASTLAVRRRSSRCIDACEVVTDVMRIQALTLTGLVSGDPLWPHSFAPQRRALRTSWTRLCGPRPSPLRCP